jgi:hypothetical protein
VDQELQEKIKLFDEGIKQQFELYRQLGVFEGRNQTGVGWTKAGEDKANKIFSTIDQLQHAKIRLINNEKIPEKIYVNQEVVKYKDRIVKRVVVHKSGLANSFVWFSFLIYSLFYILYFLGYLRIFFVLK